MKKGIHPKYHPVVFVDAGAEAEFVTRSTMKSKETREIDGVEHFVIRLDVSSASHPFFTGKQRFVDAAGRIDKFRSKYGSDYSRRAKKSEAKKPEAKKPEAKKPEAKKPEAKKSEAKTPEAKKSKTEAAPKPEPKAEAKTEAKPKAKAKAKAKKKAAKPQSKAEGETKSEE